MDLNRYAYALNDPINGMDPGGHWSLTSNSNLNSNGGLNGDPAAPGNQPNGPIVTGGSGGGSVTGGGGSDSGTGDGNGGSDNDNQGGGGDGGNTTTIAGGFAIPAPGVMPNLTVAGGAAAADGPFPIGDLIAAAIIANMLYDQYSAISDQAVDEGYGGGYFRGTNPATIPDPLALGPSDAGKSGAIPTKGLSLTRNPLSLPERFSHYRPVLRIDPTNLQNIPAPSMRDPTHTFIAPRTPTTVEQFQINIYNGVQLGPEIPISR